jgi:hypothetical protein
MKQGGGCHDEASNNGIFGSSSARCRRYHAATCGLRLIRRVFNAPAGIVLKELAVDIQSSQSRISMISRWFIRLDQALSQWPPTKAARIDVAAGRTDMRSVKLSIKSHRCLRAAAVDGMQLQPRISRTKYPR